MSTADMFGAASQPVVVIELLQQSRFQYIVPVAFVAVTVVAGFAGWLATRFGASQQAAGLAGLAAAVIAIGVIVWYFSGSQGVLEVHSDELVVRPRLRAPIRLQLPVSEVQFQVWHPVGSAFRTWPLGPRVVLRSGGASLSFATTYAELKRDVPESAQWPQTTTSPSFLIPPAGFAQLLEAVGVRDFPVPAGADTVTP